MEIVKELVDDGIVELRVRGSDGNERDVNLMAVDRSRELTEPGALYPGLGFDFQFPAVIGKIGPGSAGEQAGLRSGDRIVRFDGQPVSDFYALRVLIAERPNRDVALEVRRGGSTLAMTAHVGAVEENGHAIGRLGIGISEEFYVTQRYTGLDALTGAVAKTWETSVLSVNLMWKLVTGKLSPKGMSGVVGIAKFAGDAAQQGGVRYLGFLALISISIGVLNLVPIPILDGGQIMYQLAELLKGRPVSERAQMLGQQAGIVLLVLLMGWALFNDLAPHAS
jgi:regulator of sigma E protease